MEWLAGGQLRQEAIGVDVDEQLQCGQEDGHHLVLQRPGEHGDARLIQGKRLLYRALALVQQRAEELEPLPWQV